MSIISAEKLLARHDNLHWEDFGVWLTFPRSEDLLCVRCPIKRFGFAIWSVGAEFSEESSQSFADATCKNQPSSPKHGG